MWGGVSSIPEDIWGVMVSAPSGRVNLPALFSISLFVFGDQSFLPALILATLRTNITSLKVQ